MKKTNILYSLQLEVGKFLELTGHHRSQIGEGLWPR